LRWWWWSPPSSFTGRRRSADELSFCSRHRHRVALDHTKTEAAEAGAVAVSPLAQHAAASTGLADDLKRIGRG
jgi:hypothetical protein